MESPLAPLLQGGELNSWLCAKWHHRKCPPFLKGDLGGFPLTPKLLGRSNLRHNFTFVQNSI